jgi:hypothetical protein
MRHFELITVEGTYWLSGNGVEMLILRPDISVPLSGWKDVTEKVIVLRPGGDEFEATAHISVKHVNIRDPDVSIDRRWRVGLWLADVKKDNVPIGSKIMVSEEVRNTLCPRDGVQ